MEVITDFLISMNAYEDLSLFLMRLLVGGLFLYSGSRKIRNVKGFAQQNGLPYIVGLGTILFELVGGLGLIIGFYVQAAALMIMLVMLGALYHHIFKWKSPYWAQSKGWEYDLMWLIMAFVLMTTGGGSIALYPAFL